MGSLSSLLSEPQAGESENAVMNVRPFKNTGQGQPRAQEAECKQDRGRKWQGQKQDTKVFVCIGRSDLGGHTHGFVGTAGALTAPSH